MRSQFYCNSPSHSHVSFNFSPTVEEVTATNGESETATEEVTAAAATENGTNGVHKETTEEKPEEEKEDQEEATTSEEAKEVTEEVKEVAEEVKETDEATKRKADEPSEDETVEKIAKLKETAAEVVAEAEQKLAEPLTEAEATAYPLPIESL